MSIKRDEYSPCVLDKYNGCSFVSFKGKRLIYNKKSEKIVKNRVLERDFTVTKEFEVELKSQIEFSKNNTHHDSVFLFTENYGDRNICHWMTEQLMVLNYLIDILELIPHVKVIINRNRRQSMQSLILDYLHAIPNLPHHNIIEVNLDDFIVIDCNNIFLADSHNCTLSNIYPPWARLHSRLNLNLDRQESEKFPSQFYMSRRNIYQPDKHTNTRILENYDEISDFIVEKGYKEIFSDELKTLQERITLFRTAKTIVCELGAGLHNLLYCQDGITVYVMYQRNNVSWLQEYYPLFKKKKMKVFTIPGETTSPEHNGNWLNTPWKLSLDHLKVAFREI